MKRPEVQRSNSENRMQLVVEKSLQDYLAFCDERARSFLTSPPRTFELVKEVDSLIRDVWSGTLDAQPIPSFLNVNAYYSYLAAVRIAVSGHVSAIFPLVRAALESACYAFLVTKDARLLTVWINREKSDRERAACRRAFTSAVKETSTRLRSIQVEMADYVRDLYEASITLGAHPNPLSVFHHLEVGQDEHSDHVKVSFTAVYSETSFEVARALLACAEYGIAVAYLNFQSLDSHSHVEVLNRRFNEVNEFKNKMEDELRSGAGG
jgi:hypothetical protein